MTVPHIQTDSPVPRVKRPRNRLGEIGLGIVLLGYIIPAIFIAGVHFDFLNLFPMWTLSIAPIGFFVSLFAMRSKPKGVAMAGMALGFLAFNVAPMTLPILEKLKLKNEAASQITTESKPAPTITSEDPKSIDQPK